MIELDYTLRQSWNKFKLVIITNSVCQYCRNPIDMEVYLHMDNLKKFIRYYNTFVQFKPLDTYFNSWRFKKRKRICMGCHCSIISHPGTMITECGLLKHKRYKSLSHEEIKQWYQDFVDFWERKDVEEYIPKDVVTDYIIFPTSTNIYVYT